MAVKVPVSYDGGLGIVEKIPGGNSGDKLATVLRQMADDLAAAKVAYDDLATKYNALLAKLDIDAGVTDADYVATVAATTTDLTIGISKA